MQCCLLCSLLTRLAKSNNLLYPEVDRTNHVLLYACRNCNYQEEARQSLVFRNDLMSITKEQPGVVDNLMKDPTLRRTHDLACPECAHSESVLFQDQGKRIVNRKHPLPLCALCPLHLHPDNTPTLPMPTGMILFYVCTRCNHLFRDPSEPAPAVGPGQVWNDRKKK